MFERLLERIAQVLDEGAVRYMVIGGQAVLLYGEPRLTKDIDVTLDVSPERLSTVLPLLDAMGLEPLVDPEPFVQETMVLPCQHAETGIRVDLIFSFSPYEQGAMERVHLVELGRTQVRFASPEDIIVHKIVAGRPRDLEDVKSILSKNPGVDQPYVRHWLREYGEALDAPLVKRLDQALEEIQ